MQTSQNDWMRVFTQTENKLLRQDQDTVQSLKLIHPGKCKAKKKVWQCKSKNLL